MLAWLKALSLGKKLALGIATLFTGAVIAAPPPENTNIETTEPVEVPAKVQELEVVEPEPVIETKTVTETEPIPYETIRQNDNNLAQGTTRTATTGIAGEKTLTYEVIYTDGLETSRTLISEEVTTQPTTAIIRVGTYVAPPPPQQTSSSYVKKSRSDICHAPGTTYYSRTLHYTRYNTIQDCLNSGGRLPLR